MNLTVELRTTFATLRRLYSVQHKHKQFCSVPNSYRMFSNANRGRYHGGLKCCSHKSILLNHEQVPWTGGSVPTDAPPTNITDNYRMKFRLYFEEYQNQSNAFFMFVTDEAGAGECTLLVYLEWLQCWCCAHATEAVSRVYPTVGCDR